MTETLDDLLETLRSGGSRITAQRRAICSTLAGDDRHLTIPDLHRLAQERSGLRFDVSTVYRTIEVLEAAGRVHHVHLGHGPSVLHLSSQGEHHHLVCDVCGRTEDVAILRLDDLSRHIEREYGFVVDGVHFALAGRCAHHERNRNSG